MVLRATSPAAAWIRAVLLLLVAVPPAWFSYALVARTHGEIDAAQAAQAWPSTAGHVHFSKLVVQRVGERAVADVRFTYVVDGVSYEGRRPQYGSFWERADALDEFPVGPAKVYYSPGDPAVAVLRPGVAPFTYPFLVFSYAAGIIPAAWLLWLAIAGIRNAR
ncbi:MAG TPA: DUF3592 domain-containing protein [Ramlibacter sp.]|jgi:hypothetical protein